MESVSVYEDSIKELTRVKKSLSNQSITIDMNKLDSKSKEVIIYALAGALTERLRDTQATISGVKNV
jgi:hypothetical protein